MFDSIRKHQRILQFLLLILIFPAFVFFGVSGYDRFLSDADSVATVAGNKITRQEFDVAMRNQLEQLRRVLGPGFDAKLLDTPEARKEVLDGLITQRALLTQALDKKMTVTDAQLRDAILAIPGLKKDDGTFDIERYRVLLSAQGLTEFGFESQMRRDLLVQMLPDAVSTSAIVPRSVLDRVIRLQEQVRVVRELTFKPADFASQVKPGDDDLKKYYEQNAAAFETPESAKVQYLVLSAKAIAEKTELPADDVRSYYEQNKARYAAPEERRASHILITVERGASDAAKKAAREKAEELLGKARGGADFAELAKAHSQDPGSANSGGDLGFFRRETMLKPFADAAFSMTQGSVTGPVETEFGYHVIKLTGVKPSTGRDFDAVRPEIEAELRQQQAARKFAQAAETFSNLVYEQADSLKPAAERFGLTIQSAETLRRDGAGLPAESPLANRRVLDAVFSDDSIRNKRNTEAVEIGGNTLVSARIVEHSPARRKPFDAVRDEVRARVIEAEARRLATQAGEKRLAELRGGATPAGFSDTVAVSRVTAATIPAPAVEAVFRAPTQKLPTYVGVELGAGGYAVYEISKVTEPAAQTIAERREAYEQRIAQVYGQQQVNDLIEALKARAKVTTNLDKMRDASAGR